jgi:hypothetical protein
MHDGDELDVVLENLTPPVPTAAGPPHCDASTIADALILADLHRSASGALVYAVVGFLCCPIFSIAAMLRGFSILVAIRGRGPTARSARTNAILAIAISIAALLLSLVYLCIAIHRRSWHW